MDSQPNPEPTKKTRATKAPTKKATSSPKKTKNQPIAPTPLEPHATNPWDDITTQVPSLEPGTPEERTDAASSRLDGSTTLAVSEEDGGIPGGEPVQGSGYDSILDAESLESLPLARARDGESKSQCWERLRREGRVAGMTRKGAIAYAGGAIERLFPPPVPVLVEQLPDAPASEIPEKTEPETEKVSPIGDKSGEVAPEPAPATATIASTADSGVVGLGNFPADWPKLPANAQLQQEIAWVTANRLLVRDGSGVNLSRAMSPPPSYSALSWLETSILFPSKFADISVKATADQDDEKEFIRREKLAVEEIRKILGEMLEANG